MAAMGITRTHLHTSGHATVYELRRFVEAISAQRVIPIHLEDRDGFAELSDRVEVQNDHKCWDIDAMETRLRHLYESLHGFKTETQKHICDDFCVALGAKSKTHLADLFVEAIDENSRLAEISEPFITDGMLRNRHRTETERQEAECEVKGTVRVTDAMKRLGNITFCGAVEPYTFEYIQREVPHLKGMESARPGNRAWIDYIGVSAGRPVLGEIKCGSDQNPFYAFIQLLTYLSELATPSQLKRSVTHNLFGDSCKHISCFDLHILLADANERSDKWKLIEPTRNLVKAFRECLSRQYPEKANLLGRIVCVATQIENLESGDDLTFCWEM